MASLRKYLDTLRAVLSIVVGVLAWILSAAQIVHLPAGWVGIITAALTFLTHLGIRAKVIPWLPNANRAGSSGAGTSSTTAR